MMTFLDNLKSKIRKSTLNELIKEMKWILRYTHRYRRVIIFYIILGVIGIGMGLAGMVASKYLIDAVTGYHSVRIGFIVALILVMATGGIVMKAMTSRISAKISLKVHNELQADIYDKFLNTDWEAISGFHSGDLLNRMNNDLEVVAGSILGWIPSLVTQSLQFIGTLAIILYFDPTMALISLLSAPITLIFSRILMHRMRDYNLKMKAISSEVMAFHEESFQNVQTIKCFDLVQFFSRRMRKLQNKLWNTALEYNKFSIYTSSFMALIGMIVTYATFGWGIYRLWSGFISYGTMTMFLQLSGNLTSGFSSLIGLVPSMIEAATSAGRIMDIVELPRENEDEITTLEGNSDSTLHGLTVMLNNVKLGYRVRPLIIQDLEMIARPNEIIAIIGPSGEGKTTLLRMLLGLLKPIGGEAKLIDGNGVEIPITAVTRKFFSYVPQGNTIFYGTIADNLRMVRPDATDDELEEALTVAYAYDFIKELPEGINTIVGERGGGFSEGQSQRLSIARAILRNAPILLLDEATSALDLMTEKKVLQSIMAYGKSHTCILTTHRTSVLSMCNRVYQIKNARMEECRNELNTRLAVDF